MTPSKPAAVVFAALGDSTRTALLQRLAQQGQGTATSLTGTTGVSRQATDRHLRVLARAGLVESRRSGREVIYRIRSETLERSADWLQEIGRAWEEQLKLIKRLAEED